VVDGLVKNNKGCRINLFTSPGSLIDKSYPKAKGKEKPNWTKALGFNTQRPTTPSLHVPFCARQDARCPLVPRAFGRVLVRVRVRKRLAPFRGVEKSDLETADQGDSHAQSGLGFAYDTGRGVEQSDEEAVRWYRQAENQGHAAAQFELGFAYHRGYAYHKGQGQSVETAVRWYQQAANQRYADAQFFMGTPRRGQSDEETVR